MNQTIATNDTQAADSMRQAYIANMLSKKNMPQQMRSMGLSGGLTESAIVDNQNTYMNNRNNIDRARIEANDRARAAYEQGINGDYADYLAKQYELEGSRAETLVNMAMAQQRAAASDPQTYTARLNGKVYTGDESTIANGIINELIKQGWSQSKIEEYLRNNGMLVD